MAMCVEVLRFDSLVGDPRHRRMESAQTLAVLCDIETPVGTVDVTHTVLSKYSSVCNHVDDAQTAFKSVI